METHSLDFSTPSTDTDLNLSFVEEGVRAGFPSPAPDNLSHTLDLNKELITHPAATFFARVVGDSMRDADVSEGDILVVDRALEPQNGNMAVCFIDGEFTLKFIRLDEKEKGVVWLVPANPDFSEIKITPENDFMVWGVVSYTIKNRLKK
ncbi:MAG: translesion error-prone DNA polymerase V autoproteolytic subunit [Bacteroidales bacterium]|nr:translesion error-prone DNA polymerase V autoproteolytic subunit [Bacteroidales bacterium]